MYESDDPRSKLASASGAAPTAAAFGASSYARFYASEPQQSDASQRSWLTRGANFIVAYTEAQAGAVLARDAQCDEYVLILPASDMRAVVSAQGDTQEIGGHSITFVPPGESRIELRTGGTAIRLFSTQSSDLAGRCSNADRYREPAPHIPAFEPWPEPVGGFRIRSYSLDVPDEPGRFGKIWRCTTFMVNVFPPQLGPRDPSKLSPHHHNDFEQCSLVTQGAYEHHLRWPWTADIRQWRDDEHEHCGAPSVCVIPPRVTHTSAAVDPGVNLLIDIFSPPRRDFSDMPGWVLNADDYPAKPQEG